MSEVRNTEDLKDTSRNIYLGTEYHEEHTLVNENLKGVYVMGNAMVMIATVLMAVCAGVKLF